VAHHGYCFFVPATSWIPPSDLLPGSFATIGFYRLVCIFLSLSLLWWVFWIFGGERLVRTRQHGSRILYIQPLAQKNFHHPVQVFFSTGTVQRRSPEPWVLLLTFRRELLRTYHRYSFVPWYGLPPGSMPQDRLDSVPLGSVPFRFHPQASPIPMIGPISFWGLPARTYL
jgi:hypothetical protein